MKKLISIGVIAALCTASMMATADDTKTPYPKKDTTSTMGNGTMSGTGSTTTTTTTKTDTKPMHDDMSPGTSMEKHDGMDKHEGMGMHMDMKAMDSNGDGMVSKKEFLNYHTAMYDKMKKGPNGMISVTDMRSHMDSMQK